MDKKIIKGLIDEKLEVIQEQFSIIKEYQGKIPIIELDLFMTSIRDLYELVLSLQVENIGSAMPGNLNRPEPQKMQQEPDPAEDEPEEEARPVQQAVEEKISEPLHEKESERKGGYSSGIISMERVSDEKPPEEDILVDDEAEDTEATEREPLEAPSIQPAVDVSPVEEPAVPEPQSPPQPVDEHEQQSHLQEKSQKITFDLFSDGASSTLADRLKEGQEKRIADKLQENKNLDLRNTIGINDKFLFINELFEGNMRVYDESVQKLNESTTNAQADLLLLDLKIVYNWDSESPTVKKFVELVRRKF